MDTLLELFLTQILLHGYVIVFLAIAVSYLFIPFPLNLLIVASGAFTIDGTLQLSVLFPIVLLSAIAGDMSHFLLARFFGLRLITPLLKKLRIQDSAGRRVDSAMQTYGGGFIFLTRWLLSPLGDPVNFFVGLTSYPAKKFFLYVVLGEFVWTCVYIFLGRFLGSSWVELTKTIESVPEFIAFVSIGLLLVLIGIRLLFLYKKRRKM